MFNMSGHRKNLLKTGTGDAMTHATKSRRVRHWIVLSGNCEGYSLENAVVCSTYKKALFEWQRLRRILLADAKRWQKRVPDLYGPMVEALSNTNPKTMDNSVHSAPEICEILVTR